MSQQRHARHKALFLEALALTGEERAAFLARLGEASPEDRAEVAALLAHADAAEGAAEGFRPGEVVAGRYRIEGRIGRGGMGEVYRAEDLVVGGPVALKRLHLRSAARAETVLNEVRLARQITHPAVCRVHDVVPLGEELLISLELVEGEDLAARLRRAGSLPPAEVLRLARELCAGLAAAHAQGILHRDLKPANVLLDRQGHGRITDFGLAQSGSGRPGLAGGTPSYMAPEELEPGGRVSEQTDLYSLGLVLWELLTGQPAFPAGAFPGGLEARRLFHPPPPSERVAGVDPALDRLIRAATHPDPRRRPDSALAMAAALPGGDALGLALATGSTVSPELLAAVELGSERLAPKRAISTLGALAALLALLVGLAWGARPELGPGPRALAREQSATLAAMGFEVPTEAGDEGFLDDAQAPGLPESILYWRRVPLPAESPRRLEQLERAGYEADLAPPRPMAQLVVVSDLAGRLVHFEVDRPVARAGADGAATVDWAPAFAAAGLEPGLLEPVPGPLPQVFAATRQAFRQRPTGRRVAIAEAQGQPVLFQVQPAEEPTSHPARNLLLRTALSALFLLGVPMLAAFLGISNWRRRRVDRRGARRLALAVALVQALAALALAGHARGPTGDLATGAQIFSLLFGTASVWICYLGLEPWARRLEPTLLVAWARLLMGRFRDPLVGRSLLAGALAGAAFQAIDQLDRWACARLGAAMQFPPFVAEQLAPLCRGGWLAAALLANLGEALAIVLPMALLLVIARWWLPRRLARPAAFLVLTGICWALIANSPGVSLFVGAPLTAAVVLATLESSGLLGVLVASALGLTLAGSPPALAPGAWYSHGLALALGLTLATGVLGAYLAGRSGGGEKSSAAFSHA
ncbi:MAG: serine/threonine-protein kinase [Thermoanaerobaculia bacterium]